MQKKSGLGRGMNAILGTGNSEYSKRKSEEAGKTGVSEDVSRETSLIKISIIEQNTNQPRKKFDEESMKELTQSIKDHGVLQPILLRKKGQMYEIIAGERRWRAAKEAGLKEIPAVIREMDSIEASETSLIENIQREDLGSIEEAKAYKKLIDEYGITQEELARRLSKKRVTITNSLRLLQLDERVMVLVEEKELTAGHARALLGLEDKDEQYRLAKTIIEKGMSVRQTEKLVKNNKKNSTSEEKKNETEEMKNMYIKAAENELTEVMKTKVSIKQTGKNKGRIEIEYYSEEDLNNLIERLR